jgi:hypothetical protein
MSFVESPCKSSFDTSKKFKKSFVLVLELAASPALQAFALEERSFVFDTWYGQLTPVTFLSRSVALQAEAMTEQCR